MTKNHIKTNCSIKQKKISQAPNPLSLYNWHTNTLWYILYHEY